MLSFRATTAMGETHCLDLLTTSKALMLLRVPSRHPPVSLSFQRNCSQQLTRRKGERKNMGNMGWGEERQTERQRAKDKQDPKGE